MTAVQRLSLTSDIAEVRLQGSHEVDHPWLPHSSHSAELVKDTLKGPLLRLWDRSSGSQPNDSNKMRARDHTMELSSIDQRRNTLAKHLDHSDWDPSPYISFSSRAEDIEELARFRSTRYRSGSPKLVVINPQVRLRKGLPTLSVEKEMTYYKIPNPYANGNKYMQHHHVCLWEIAPDEVVGCWDWHQLKAKGLWYEDVVLPAFRRHENSASSLPLVQSSSPVIVQQSHNHSKVSDVAELFSGLSIRHSARPVPRSSRSDTDETYLSGLLPRNNRNSESHVSSTDEYKLFAEDDDDGVCRARDIIKPGDDETDEFAVSRI